LLVFQADSGRSLDQPKADRGGLATILYVAAKPHKAPEIKLSTATNGPTYP
jgi:hypothetical protein